MYAVIMAGGGGTRLWPLSSPERPKPFLPLLGAESLLQRTVARLMPLIPEADVTVVTDRHHRELVRAQLPGVRILSEPTGRNTAPAVALACAAIDRPDDEVMLVLPADHLIRNEDEEGFRTVLRAADGIAREFDEIEPLVTLGVRIGRPATEYGYLIPDLDRARDVNGLRAYPLRAFEEKPNQARARQLADEPGVAWNAGIFLWRRRAIRAALERYTALLTMIGPAVGSETALAAAYDRLRPISIDYAVMEGAAADGRVVMGAMNIGWSDLGSWTALIEALGGSGIGRVVQPGETVDVGPDDIMVERIDGRLVATAGGPGPGSMTPHMPVALLQGARASEGLIAALVARCFPPEA